jgi:hypothetical protein
MKCDATGTFPKKIISSTGLSPGMFNDDLSFTFNAKDVHTTDPKEIDKMFSELDVYVAKYKKDLVDHIENAKPKK